MRVVRDTLILPRPTSRPWPSLGGQARRCRTDFFWNGHDGLPTAVLRLRVSSRSEIFDSLHPWRLPWCQCVALGEVHLEPEAAHIFFFAGAGNRVPSIPVQASCPQRVAFRVEKKFQKNLRVGGRDHRYSFRTRQWNGSPRKFTRARYLGALLPPPNNAAAERTPG